MIEVQRLTKRFGTVLAVDDLSFGVRPGLVTGFLGPNGAGKSTTLRMILGLDTPSDGQALVHGRRYRALPYPLRTVGSLLDASAVQGGRSARAHLSWLAASNDLPSSRVAAALQTAGLTEVAHRRVGTFSLGMRQRLGIAAALLGDPQVLILDEPVNGLDPDGIIWIRGLLRGLAAQGRTVLISSHLISELERCAEHLIVIGRGRLLADATVTQFMPPTAWAMSWCARRGQTTSPRCYAHTAPACTGRARRAGDHWSGAGTDQHLGQRRSDPAARTDRTHTVHGTGLPGPVRGGAPVPRRSAGHV